MSSASSNLTSNTSSAAGFDESYEGDDEDEVPLESELLQSASGFTLSLCICFLLDWLLSFFELGLFFETGCSIYCPSSEDDVRTDFICMWAACFSIESKIGWAVSVEGTF